MSIFIPEAIFSFLLLSGVPPRAAMIASDAVLYPAWSLLLLTEKYPCVVSIRDDGTRILVDQVDGPPGPSGSGVGPYGSGFYTWNCGANTNSSLVMWRSRGSSDPMPPWMTARCVMDSRCGYASFYISSSRGVSAPVPWF